MSGLWAFGDDPIRLRASDVHHGLIAGVTTVPPWLKNLRSTAIVTEGDSNSETVTPPMLRCVKIRSGVRSQDQKSSVFVTTRRQGQPSRTLSHSLLSTDSWCMLCTLHTLS